ncbi:putative oxidoreductase [Gelidibacter algens]|uniref:Putative oxidoreductase n=1 Tax=Gelidibacter algens TaxID=49280 RepID=A0A327SB00_9FLAO|nr:DoxX family protein [Gelidibacter algens]RAJ25104.1 putative oxidoreductase [Gelidibacter algens]
MKVLNNNFILRIAVAIIFLSHSLHGIFTGNDVNTFGHLFLDEIGFSPFGVAIAWIIVISQIITSVLLFINKFTKISCSINILILVVGIVTVHFKEGWFVVGAGTNGMEFSFILIAVLLSILLPNGLNKNINNS